MSKKLHLSKIIITNDKTPLINGGILVENHQIIQVGYKNDFGDLNCKNFEVINHKDSLICPGFINSHCHLAYSGLANIEGKEGLFPWLKNLLTITKGWDEQDYISSIKKGIELALSTGTTYIVENTPDIEYVKEIANSPLKALIGIEVFGSDEEKAEEVFLSGEEKLLNIKTLISNPMIDFTFSPHAPYDVSVPLWRKLISWCEKEDKLLLTHLEESPQEKVWWEEKDGPAINFWNMINTLTPKMKYWKKYSSGVDFLNKNNLLSNKIIATHLCQANKNELQLLKEKNIKLVHCPRSNFYLKNGIVDLKSWIEFNFNWSVGTDSTASNWDLDLLEEVRFAVKQQEQICGLSLSCEEAIRSITSNAAKVLSKEKEIGSLKSGFFADFLVFNLDANESNTYQSPYNYLFYNVNNKKDLKSVWINGEIAWQKDRLLHRI